MSHFYDVNDESIQILKKINDIIGTNLHDQISTLILILIETLRNDSALEASGFGVSLNFPYLFKIPVSGIDDKLIDVLSQKVEFLATTTPNCLSARNGISVV